MPIRVLIVDDSSLFREALREVLMSDPEIVVIGTASNGKQAVEKTEKLRPDLITMDIQMPIMDGLDAIEKIMAYYPTPILVVTVSASQMITFQALARGALDLVKKPTAWPGTREEQAELLRKIKLLSTIKVVRHVAGSKPKLTAEPKLPTPQLQHRVVTIAGSTGGPRALHRILTSLPTNFPTGLLVVQHISDDFSAGLAEWLDHECAIRVRLAHEGNQIEPGLALIAPEGFHMMVASSGRVTLDKSEPLDGHRPSATLLFRSAAKIYGAGVVAVILTGMGRDGADGMRDIFAGGGINIAQDKISSAVFGMPKAAIELGVVHTVLSLDEIPKTLMRVVGIA